MLEPRTSAVLTLVAAALATSRPEAQTSLFVTSRFGDEVLRYDLATGTFQQVFASGGGLDNPVGLTFGPDGNLYVASAATDQVLRYDGASGVFLGVFAQGGGLDDPRQLNFGPDGDLYVANAATNSILRYDGVSGAFRDEFARGGGLNGPTSFTFGPDGSLYVGSVLTNRIKRYNGTTGGFIENFVTTNLNGPHDLSFGPDGDLYVSNAFSTRLQRFDGRTGAFLGTFVQHARLSAPLGLCWDEAGDLLVVNQGRDEVLRYDGLTGAFLGEVFLPAAGGLSAPLFACFEPTTAFAVSLPAPPVAGLPNLVLVQASPGARLLLGIGDRHALRLVPDCPRPVGLPGSLLEVPVVADESGRAPFRWLVPAQAVGTRPLLRAVDPLRCRGSAPAHVSF